MTIATEFGFYIGCPEGVTDCPSEAMIAQCLRQMANHPPYIEYVLRLRKCGTVSVSVVWGNSEVAKGSYRSVVHANGRTETEQEGEEGPQVISIQAFVDGEMVVNQFLVFDHLESHLPPNSLSAGNRAAVEEALGGKAPLSAGI
jgi:hypothetical protein